jgi:hypothetical protein
MSGKMATKPMVAPQGSYSFRILSDPSAIDGLPVGLPAKIVLNQNYPNPFNPETTVKYYLPEKAEVTLKIFNITGQEIRTLVNNTLPAGEHWVSWNGINRLGNPVSSGVYLYQLKAGGQTQFRRMLLLK